MDNIPIKQRNKIINADDIDQDIYQKVPVANFGLQILQKMGFSQEKGIGKSNKNALKQPVVLKPRPKGLGLGADPDGLSKQKQQQQDKYKFGKRMKIINGKHKDLIGLIIKVNEEEIIIQLQISQQNVTVKKEDVEQYDEQKQKKQRERSRSKEKIKKPKSLKWVIPGIKVKVIDKKSSLYLQNLWVSDITSDTAFNCIDENKKIINNLTEKQIQTYLPKSESIVIILKGEYRGKKAKLKQRIKKEHVVYVQTVDQFEFIKLTEDDVAQYRQ